MALSFEVLTTCGAARRGRLGTPHGAVESCDWVRVEDGIIKEIRSFYDTSRVREALSESEQARLGGEGEV